MVDLYRPLCIIAIKFLYTEVKKNKKILHTSHKECKSVKAIIQRSTKVNRVQPPLVVYNVMLS